MYEPLDVEDGDSRRDSESSLLAEGDFKWSPTSRQRIGRLPSLETQRNGLLALLLVLVLALAGQSVVHHKAPRQPPSRLQPPPPPPPPSPALAPQFELRPSHPSTRHDDLNRGRWEAPSRVWTKDTVVEVWGSGALNAGHMRTTELSAFSWRPEGEIRNWDTFDFLKRMYNSEKGLLLVGDSVTLQSVEALKSMMNLPSLSNGYRGKSYSWYQKATGSPLHQALFASNATLELLRRALPNVPAERFAQPFAHILRHDTLLHPDELRSLAVAEGLGESVKFEGWLQNSTWEAVLPMRKEKEWEGEENSVLFFNTGAHWSLVCLGLDASGLAKLGRAAARTLLARLNNIPSLDLIYRSTTPAHPDCEHATTPLYPAPPFIEFHKHPDWSWGTFGDMNHVWADELDAAAPEGLSKSGASVSFLNVTEMGGQRPDAHMANGDCLHWALPVVPGTWIKLVWTIVMENK